MLMLNPSSASQLVLSPQPLLQNRVRAFVDVACRTHKKLLVWISAIQSIHFFGRLAGL